VTPRTREYLIGNALALLTALVIGGLAFMYLAGMTPGMVWRAM